MTKHHDIQFISNGRTATEQPNPAYPDGIDLNLAGGRKACLVELPYPAPECGVYIITCKRCPMRIGVTTAGRIDDPKTVKMACGSMSN